MNKLQYSPVLHVMKSSRFSQLTARSEFVFFSESIHIMLIQTKVSAYVQPPFVQKIYKLNKVLIFEEIPPDSFIPVCPHDIDAL